MDGSILLPVMSATETTGRTVGLIVTCCCKLSVLLCSFVGVTVLKCAEWGYRPLERSLQNEGLCEGGRWPGPG